MEFPVALHIPDLQPLENTPRGIAGTIVDNMVGYVESGVLDADELAQTDGPLPVYEGVQPFGVKSNNVRIESTPTADRNHIFQDADGTIAMVDDAYGIADTVILPEGLVSVDWDSGNEFMCILSGNRQPAFYMAHSRAGREIDLLLINNGTNQVVTAFDAAIQWSGGSAPVMPAALAGTSAMQKITLRNINDIIYGEYLNYELGAPVVT